MTNKKSFATIGDILAAKKGTTVNMVLFAAEFADMNERFDALEDSATDADINGIRQQQVAADLALAKKYGFADSKAAYSALIEYLEGQLQ